MEFINFLVRVCRCFSRIRSMSDIRSKNSKLPSKSPLGAVNSFAKRLVFRVWLWKESIFENWAVKIIKNKPRKLKMGSKPNLSRSKQIMFINFGWSTQCTIYRMLWRRIMAITYSSSTVTVLIEKGDRMNIYNK